MLLVFALLAGLLLFTVLESRRRTATAPSIQPPASNGMTAPVPPLLVPPEPRPMPPPPVEAPAPASQPPAPVPPQIVYVPQPMPAPQLDEAPAMSAGRGVRSGRA
jgi:outer membrane biosynthesis protein TonB